MNTENGLNSEKRMNKKRKKSDIPFIVYLISFIVFMVPPMLEFIFGFFIYGITKTAWREIIFPLFWACIYKQFLTDMKENNINQDVFSKFEYIFLIELFTYGLPIICLVRYILENGWF